MYSPQGFKPLTKDDIAELLGVSIRTVENWVVERVLPAPTKLGSRVYWHPRAFFDWLDKRLLDGGQDLEPVQADNTTPAEVASQPLPGKQAKSKGKRLATESEALRARDQAKLDALLA